MAPIQQPETGLTLSDQPREIEHLTEYNTDAAMMREAKKIEASIIVAQKFKRNEDAAYAGIMNACRRTSFAERAEFKYPRGKKFNEETQEWEDNIISGPSVYLSREMIRLWGNARVYTEIIADTDDVRTIRSVAWDMQTNLERSTESTFRKLIQRRKKVPDPKKPGKMKDAWPPVTEWVRPDERDLRELHNKYQAIAERNVTLQILPEDFIYDARQQSRLTVSSEVQQDPEAAKKKIILGFNELNVPIDELEKYLGHGIASASPKELMDLRGIWTAIRDGNTTWAEIIEANDAEEGETIGEDKANEFFKAYKESGYSVQDCSEFLLKEWKIKDSRKIPIDGFDKAMAWAKTPKNGASKVAAPKEGEIIKDNPDAPPVGAHAQDVTPAADEQQSELPLDIDPETMKKIDQLFDLLKVPAQRRKDLLKEYNGKFKELVVDLEDDLEGRNTAKKK